MYQEKSTNLTIQGYVEICVWKLQCDRQRTLSLSLSLKELVMLLVYVAGKLRALPKIMKSLIETQFSLC